MSNSRVFILHEQLDRDMSSALKYGKLCPVFAQDARPATSIKQSIETLQHVLKDFDPDQDYVAWVGGDQIVLLLLGAYLASKRFQHIQWLWWNRERDPQTGLRNPAKGYYVPRKIELNNLFYV